MAIHCDFGKAAAMTEEQSKALLNDTLRDRLVVGICSKSIQRALLSKTTPFKKPAIRLKPWKQPPKLSKKCITKEEKEVEAAVVLIASEGRAQHQSH